MCPVVWHFGLKLGSFTRWFVHGHSPYVRHIVSGLLLVPCPAHTPGPEPLERLTVSQPPFWLNPVIFVLLILLSHHTLQHKINPLFFRHSTFCLSLHSLFLFFYGTNRVFHHPPADYRDPILTWWDSRPSRGVSGRPLRDTLVTLGITTGSHTFFSDLI